MNDAVELRWQVCAQAERRSLKIAEISSASLSPWCARFPVAISKTIAPKEKMSERASTGRP